MKKYLGLINVAVLAMVINSCTSQEGQKGLELVVDNYMQVKLADEMLKHSEADITFTLDSIQVVDTVTRKKQLGYEILEIRDKSSELTVEAKALKKKVQDKVDLAAMYSDLSSGEDAYTETIKHDLEALKEEFVQMTTLAASYEQQINEKFEEMKSADSTKVLYYYIVAHYKVTDNKTSVQKSVQAPFHISLENKILTEPDELLKKK